MGQRQLEVMTEFLEKTEKIKELQKAAQSQGEMKEDVPELPVRGGPSENSEAREVPRLNTQTMTDPDRKHEYDQKLREVLGRGGASSHDDGIDRLSPEMLERVV